MPLVWEPNALFLEHNGVRIYHIYKDDSYAAGPRLFRYATTDGGRDTGTAHGEFDVRDLRASAGRDVGFLGDEALIRAAMCRAIESGEMTPEGVQEDEA